MMGALGNGVIGNTAVSGTVIQGSSPCSPTKSRHSEASSFSGCLLFFRPPQFRARQLVHGGADPFFSCAREGDALVA